MLYTRHMALMAAGLLFGNIFTGQPRRKSLIRKSLPKALPAALGNLRVPEAGNRKGSQEVSSVSCNHMVYRNRVHIMDSHPTTLNHQFRSSKQLYICGSRELPATTSFHQARRIPIVFETYSYFKAPIGTSRACFEVKCQFSNIMRSECI